jgi:hypothetical protein
VTWQRGIDGFDPHRAEALSREGAVREYRYAARGRRLGTGTLACPHCDAPVAPNGRLSPSQALACPFCGHGGPVRDFLSLAAPARPARVQVVVVERRPAGP